MGEARRRGLVLAGVTGGHVPAGQKAEPYLQWHRRRHAKATRAEAESLVALELERTPESLPDGLSGPERAELERQAQRQQVQERVGYYARKRMREILDSVPQECVDNGCAVDGVHAPGCSQHVPPELTEAEGVEP